jgi:hypothetical protein
MRHGGASRGVNAAPRARCRRGSRRSSNGPVIASRSGAASARTLRGDREHLRRHARHPGADHRTGHPGPGHLPRRRGLGGVHPLACLGRDTPGCPLQPPPQIDYRRQPRQPRGRQLDGDRRIDAAGSIRASRGPSRIAHAGVPRKRPAFAASAQNQALSALLFLCPEVLGQDLPWLSSDE